MAGLLLETKLYVPRARRGAVPRARLSGRLERAEEARLTLISAPPGSGKTTLLAEWLAEQRPGRSAAWVSLDGRDNDAATFWRYVVAALRRVAPQVGEQALALLESGGAPAVEELLGGLINELGRLAGDVVLVLDDYHVIEDREIHEGLRFLVEHLPPQLHLVVASRADPPLPLARLRARGELVEIRASDLRFTAEEAAAYLNEAMGLGLTAAEVSTLEGRTEGWIAALQLAALSIQGRENAGALIEEFAGDDRYVVDYLVEEVLLRQSEEVRSFLLRTAVLDRLTGPLCDALTGEPDGSAMLERLERANLFVVPLDDRRRWYRYHHLFADVLRARLLEEGATEAVELHRRASGWFEAQGELAEAVRHATAAGDGPGLARLVELAAPEMFRNRQEGTVRQWLAAIPSELLRFRPVLSNLYAGSFLSGGLIEGVEGHLQDAERWLEPTGELRPRQKAEAAGMVVANEAGLRLLPGSVALHRAGLALGLGRVEQAEAYAGRVLELAPDDDQLTRGGAAGILGLLAWGSGDLEAAHRFYAESMANLERAGHLADAIGLARGVADIQITLGRLGEARRTYERALRLASDQGGATLRGMADMYVGLSTIACERGELETAQRLLEEGQALGEHAGLPQNRYRTLLVRARLAEASGDLEGALAHMDQAERVYVSELFPNVRPMGALRARLLLRLGRVGEALGWARQQGLSAEDEPSYLRECEHISLAWILLSQSERGGQEEAQGLLERLLVAAETGGRTGSAIELLVLLALARQQRGEAAEALSLVGRALALAEPEGYVRVFLDEGTPMLALLKRAASTGERVAAEGARRVLAAAGGPEEAPRVRPQSGLPEPLSEREMEVLQLLRGELDGPEMARELVVSLNTLRTHTKNIYSKLGVSSRMGAVRRAEELGLLGRP